MSEGRAENAFARKNPANGTVVKPPIREVRRVLFAVRGGRKEKMGMKE